LDASFITELIREHRAIEERLDGVGEAVQTGEVRALAALLAGHYSKEERFLDEFGEKLAAKLRGQHEEALEIAARLVEALEAGEDAVYLTRRLLAIAQHNIIEEERDVFPLARRFGDQV
jgi:replication-associated recombination protein RarA